MLPAGLAVGIALGDLVLGFSLWFLGFSFSIGGFVWSSVRRTVELRPKWRTEETPAMDRFSAHLDDMERRRRRYGKDDVSGGEVIENLAELAEAILEDGDKDRRAKAEQKPRRPSP